MPVRPAPPAAMRHDAWLVATLATIGCLMVALTATMRVQFVEVPMWQPMLASVLLPIPLLWRRRAPVISAVVLTLIYAVAVEFERMELYASQVALFLGFYSIGAWLTDRKLAYWSRLVLVVLLGLWLASAAVRGFSDPETGERGVSVYFAFLLLQIIVNVFYFGGAWVFGNRAWNSAVEAARLAEAHVEIEAQQARLAEQAVSLERVRIARELHDVVAHHVSAMGIQAGAARRMLTVDTDKAADALRHVESSAREAIGELRSLVVTLRSDDDSTASAPDLDALPTLVEAATAAGQATSLTTVGEPRPVSAMAGLTAYRIVQEALTNARKHAGPTAKVDVRVRYLSDALEVEVADDGHGRALPAAASNTATIGAGLLGMRERIGALDGELEAGPRSRGGWLVRARVPAPECAAQPTASAPEGSTA